MPPAVTRRWFSFPGGFGVALSECTDRAITSGDDVALAGG